MPNLTPAGGVDSQAVQVSAPTFIAVSRLLKLNEIILKNCPSYANDGDWRLRIKPENPPESDGRSAGIFPVRVLSSTPEVGVTGADAVLSSTRS
jgi:hypothetical protein